MARVILATIGSLGDLHPFIAIGRALAAQGEEVLLAVPEDGVAKARAAGLDAEAILPGTDAIHARIGLSAPQFAARLIADPNFVIDEVLLPSLAASTRALDALAADADVLAASFLVLAAGVVAEKRSLPLASVLLQPMALYSAWDPPAGPPFGPMRHNPRTAIGRGWNRLFLALGRPIMRRRYAARIDAVRAEHGLGPARAAPLMDHGPATAAVICCWSRAFSALPPDAPGEATLTGFPYFDSESGADDALAPELRDFLDAGDAPLVFTLGSVMTAAAGRFYDEAAAAARACGCRALLLTGGPGPSRRDGGCMVMPYAPHSAVFPRAAGVIHHGGMGAAGQALRAGAPQIVVPHNADQFDNAARLRAAGVGLTIKRERFGRSVAARTIGRVLGDPGIAEAARRGARIIAPQDGAATAARHIRSLC